MARKQLAVKPFCSFITPSLWRPSVEVALASILDQTVQNWESIVVIEPHVDFDGELLPKDQRFTVVNGPKEASGSAGELRNYGIRLAEGEWIAFLDDDDHISNQYLEHLAEHTADFPRCDVIIFRMDDPRLGILPRPDSPKIAKSHVGISFAVRASVMKRHQFIRENVAERAHEDWALLEELKNSGCGIYLSPYVDYFVRGGTS